jgi:hypothetical protein
VLVGWAIAYPAPDKGSRDAWLLWIAILLQTHSVAFGAGLALNRLYDFRWSARHRNLSLKVARMSRAQVQAADVQTELDALHHYATRLGRISWVLLGVQVSFWLVSVIPVGILVATHLL